MRNLQKKISNHSGITKQKCKECSHLPAFFAFMFHLLILVTFTNNNNNKIFFCYMSSSRFVVDVQPKAVSNSYK